MVGLLEVKRGQFLQTCCGLLMVGKELFKKRRTYQQAVEKVVLKY